MNGFRKLIRTLPVGERQILEHHVLWQGQPRFGIDLVGTPGISDDQKLDELYCLLEEKGYLLSAAPAEETFRTSDGQKHVRQKYILNPAVCAYANQP